MRKKLPIGLSDFKELIETNYYFVDKSLFIKELIDDGSKVVLLTRPRRFGKTLNMTMLRYFFEKTSEDNAHLFHGLKIWQNEELRGLQGKYPVIYMTFKDAKSEKFDSVYCAIKKLIAEEYERHNYLLENGILTVNEENFFNRITSESGSRDDYEFSLKKLADYMERYHKQKVVLLMDEYDTPIHGLAFTDSLKEALNFMRNLLSGVLKDNASLEKAVLTGILRVSKESIFSGLNNLNVCTVLDDEYSDKFGLLEPEVEELMNYYGIETHIHEVKHWYNGYIFGDNVIYNPWSIINYAKKWEGGFQVYWVNTSSNDLVDELITKGDVELKQELEELIKGGEIRKEVCSDIVFGEIKDSAASVWSFLLFSGYLKPTKKERESRRLYCTLKIPNEEVLYLYEKIVSRWFEKSIRNRNMELMLKSLTSGDIETFSYILREFVVTSMSFFDVCGNGGEKVYHAFVLGLLVNLGGGYEVRSNRESGFGRYDVMVIPKDTGKRGIVFEFKKVNPSRGEDLQKAAGLALEQIEQKEYRQELFAIGVKTVTEIGVAFEGKELLVEWREVCIK